MTCEVVGKPKLVLDLDHTVVHCIEAFPENSWRDPEWHTLQMPLEKNHNEEETSSPAHQCMYFKMRPHARAVLRALSDCFEIYVYSLGKRDYVDRIVRVLDPTGVCIPRWRVCSRTEQNNLEGKSLALMNRQLEQRWKQMKTATTTIFVPLCLHETLILDDRLDVWAPSEHTHVFQLAAFHTAPDKQFTVPVQQRTRDLSLVRHVLPRLLEAARSWNERHTLSAWLPLQRREVLQGCRIMMLTNVDAYRFLAESSSGDSTHAIADSCVSGRPARNCYQPAATVSDYMHWSEQFGAECFYATDDLPILRNERTTSAGSSSGFGYHPLHQHAYTAFRSLELSMISTPSPLAVAICSDDAEPDNSLPCPLTRETLSVLDETSPDDDDVAESVCLSLSDIDSLDSWMSIPDLGETDTSAMHRVEQMTHLVYTSLEDVRFSAAMLRLLRDKKIHLVHVWWLRDSCLRMARMDEKDYLVEQTH